jgi:hypothetical protein
MSDEEQLWNILKYGKENSLSPEVVNHFHQILKKKSIRRDTLQNLEDSLIKIYIQQTAENYYTKSQMKSIANKLLEISETMDSFQRSF